ncbi:MAG: 2-oxoisovalerate dehydrogenase component [Pseudonocardiales bacterium]|nr:2-oxoisovalerate dehydrogenase component [Pseudonocardiales bacterium]
MPADRHPLEEYFVGALSGLQRAAARAIDGPVRAGSALTVRLADELFTAQCESRHADLAAKYLQAQGRGYYTIASAGHEGNAAVAAALRPSDPALLHYRSGGFYCARSHQLQGHDPVYDILAGVVSAVTEPIAGGRHKVFGNHDLAVIPQTSTIASHLPRAVGLAFGIDRARRLGLVTPWPDDAIVVTSFGDASVNHSTLVGAFNSTSNAVYQGIGMPMLMVCEDNGFGISTRTPSGWIAERFSARPGLRYFAVDGSDLADVYDAATEAVNFVRTNRKPAFLHLKTVRFLGHAGSDAEVAYRTPSEISADYARDPLLASARLLAAAGTASGAELLERYEAVRVRTAAVAAEVSLARQLASAEEVLAPLAPRSARVVAAAVGAGPSEGLQTRDTARAAIFGGALPEHDGPLTLAQSINRALHDELARRPAALVFGEDVSAKGGVYGLTRGLRKTFGGARVFDTLLDEQAILGLALGTSLAGFLPIPEIQYLAYLHNAEDQLRGEASTLQFFSQGQFRNPMVVRVAGLGYQKGFGGHFHNDNSVAVLRDIPGLVVGVPSHPRDAPAMLRTLTAAAVVDGTVSVFLEPIALYHQRNLYAEGDNGWLADYLPPGEWADGHVPIGRARRWLVDDSDGTDLTILTFGNGVPMSLRTAKLLSEQGISVRVVDLRWLAPLPVTDILRESEATGRVLIVDETRRSGGVSEGVIAALVDGGFGGVIERVTSADSFIPLGDAARAVLLDEPTVVRAALGLLARS